MQKYSKVKKRKNILVKHIQMEKNALKQALKDDKYGKWHGKDQLQVISTQVYGWWREIKQ